MSALDAIKKAKESANVQQEEDRLGGGGPLESGLYPAEIALAYLGESQGGAINVTFHLKTEGGREHRETVYITSGKAKGQLPYYVKDGVEYPLPGYSVANAIAALSTGMEIEDLDVEDKVLKLYNFEAGKEMPTEVKVFPQLEGQKIQVGILKVIDDKRAKGDDGQYHPTGETRTFNEIDKIFEAETGLTMAEKLAGAEKGIFIDQWVEKNAGQTRNKAQGAAAGGATAGAPAPAAGAAPAPKKSLFGK